MKFLLLLLASVVLAGCNSPPSQDELIGAYGVPIHCLDMTKEEPAYASNLTEEEYLNCKQALLKAYRMDEQAYDETWEEVGETLKELADLLEQIKKARDGSR